MRFFSPNQIKGCLSVFLRSRITIFLTVSPGGLFLTVFKDYHGADDDDLYGFSIEIAIDFRGEWAPGDPSPLLGCFLGPRRRSIKKKSAKQTTSIS